jgi:hypothetical protein
MHHLSLILVCNTFFRLQDQVVIVPLRVNVNLKAVTVEDLVARRQVTFPIYFEFMPVLSFIPHYPWIRILSPKIYSARAYFLGTGIAICYGQELKVHEEIKDMSCMNPNARYSRNFMRIQI